MDLRVSDCVERHGRLFATWSLGANVGNTAVKPLISLDTDRLEEIAKSSGLVDNLPPHQKPLLYLMFMNEVGEIIGLEQIRGPHIPAVESSLMHTPVISPGSRGGEPVPVAFAVEVGVP